MIRPARPDDADAVASLLIESRRVFLPYAPSIHTVAEVHDWVARTLLPAGGVVAWDEGGRIVAVLATSTDAGVSWIDQFYVLPGFEGRGIGSRLIADAHARLRRPVRLHTFQQNTRARAFYERHGYRAVAFTDGQGNEERCPDVLYELIGA